MDDQRLAYDDPSTPAEMRADCQVVEQSLHLERVVRDAVRPAPSIRYEHFPREVGKPGIEVSEAAARLAAALHLQLDGEPDSR